MANITIMLSDYLDEKELCIMDLEYFTNGISQVTTTSDVTLFDALPQLRFGEVSTQLPETSHRFFLYDVYGIIYTEDLTKKEFEKELPTLLNQPLKELPLNIPSHLLMGPFIELAVAKGFSIESYTERYVEAWQNTDPKALMDVVERNMNQETPYSDPMELLAIDEGADGELVFIDYQHRRVFELLDDGTQYGRNSQLYFDIRNKEGQIVLKKATYFQLLPALYLLMENFSLPFIRNLLLRFDFDKEYSTAFSDLMYLCYERTRKQPVKDAGGVYKSSNNVADRDNPLYDHEFRFWSDRSQKPSEHVILTEEVGMIVTSSHIYDDKEERKQLSDLLVTVAKDNGYDIYQTDRFYHHRTSLDNIEYVDGELKEYNRLFINRDAEYHVEDEIPMVRVYDLVDRVTGERVLKDLPMDQFLTHLLIKCFVETMERGEY